MNPHPDPFPYFITGMFIFFILTGIWLYFEGKKIDKEPISYHRPRKDIRKWDIETYYYK